MKGVEDMEESLERAWKEFGERLERSLRARMKLGESLESLGRNLGEARGKLGRLGDMVSLDGGKKERGKNENNYGAEKV